MVAERKDFRGLIWLVLPVIGFLFGASRVNVWFGILMMLAGLIAAVLLAVVLHVTVGVGKVLASKTGLLIVGIPTGIAALVGAGCGGTFGGNQGAAVGALMLGGIVFVVMLAIVAFFVLEGS